MKEGAAGNRAQVATFLLASSQQPSTDIADTARANIQPVRNARLLNISPVPMQKGRLRSKGQATTT